eukprot:1306390-Prymnesium_polylepis.1
MGAIGFGYGRHRRTWWALGAAAQLPRRTKSGWYVRVNFSALRSKLGNPTGTPGGDRSWVTATS